MNIRVEKSKTSGVVEAIASKSFAHRILICDFLSGNNLRKEFNGFCSKDILATYNCLSDIKSGKRVLDCDESGSTLRFLLPLCAGLGGEFTFLGRGRLLSRPNTELLNSLSKNGISFEENKDNIKIWGKLKAGEIEIRGDISSQYVSGLIMALATLDSDSKIILTSPLASKPYVDITLSVLKGYGIKVQSTDYGYFIKGSQKFSGSLDAEGDWSNMAFYLVLGAINGGITVSGLNLQSVQGDKKILDILKSANADITVGENQITVSKSQLNGFSMDANDCPDLVPICAVLGALASGKTIIHNIERLRLKESDRVFSTIEMLKSFGIKAEEKESSMIIYGGKASGGVVNSFNDHRIVMSSAVLGAVACGESKILDAGAVNKSYPTFFDDFKSVGGKASEL
ncbi:MAG: 3-phosphoshikimate 1-carboxyvinyltransferase [Clostridiales bacterium]|nr:3-phosphoshikimate 1-carboxyvinyltransferase [Clostridiales bacterium]